MRKIVSVFFVLLCAAVFTAADNITVIKDGTAENIWFRKGENSQQKGYVKAMGYGLVISGTALGKGDFTVSCKLELEKIGGTAASFFFNGNNFGFDCGNGPGKCFLEGPDILQPQETIQEPVIKAGIPFTFVMERRNDELFFYIDGEKVAATKTNLDDDVIFAIRPHRNTVRIFDFHAVGNIGLEANEDVFAMESSIKQKFPIISQPVDISKNLEIPLLKKTKYKKLLLHFTLNIHLLDEKLLVPVKSKDAKQYITIPADCLKKIYNASPDDFNTQSVRVQAFNEHSEMFNEYAFVAFSPEKKMGFPGSKVQKINGRVRVVINNKLIDDAIAYQHEEYEKFKGEQVAGFAGSGVKLYRYLLADYLYWKDGITPDLDAIYNAIEASMLRMITHSPDSRMLLTWYIYMPSSFCEQYPQEALKLDTGGKSLQNTPGKTLQPSYASAKWREMRKKIITEILQRIAKAPWAERLIGIQLAYANAGEWNNWGYHEKAFPDFSVQMQTQFSLWLKNKYKTPEKLQLAWGNPRASFNNPVPSSKQRMGLPNTFFRVFPRDNQVVDYYIFWQQMTVDAIDYYAKIIKNASDGKLLVGAYYGYYLGHLPNTPYHFQDSGHYGMEYYLRSPNLDFLCSPYPYASRRIHCPLNYVFSSFTLHDKWMFIENDQRTQRSGKSQIIYGATYTLHESCEIAKRDFGLNLSRGSSYCFMDFASGWYKDKEFLDTIKRLNVIAPIILEQPLQKAQVAVLVGEQGIPDIAQQAGKALVPTFEFLRRELDQAGAPYDLYYSEDIDKIDFDGYKVIILANCLKFTAEQAELINKKIKTDKRNIIMLYGIGAIGDNGFDFKRMQLVTGIDMTMLPNVELKSISCDKIKGRQQMRVYAPFSPVFAVTDESAVPLGKINGKFVGVCEKQFSDYKVFYVGYTGLYWEWLKYFYKRCNVHICLSTPDTLYNNGPFYCIYTRSAGTRMLEFPRQCEVVYDLYEGKELARNVKAIKLDFTDRPTTTLIYAGKRLSDKNKELIYLRNSTGFNP